MIDKCMKFALFGLVMLGMTGCAGGIKLGGEPARLYTLTPKTSLPKNSPAVDWQLLIEEPDASSGLDTPRIALARTPLNIDYYRNVAWVDRAPSMVQTMMVQTFENSGRIVAVGRKSVNLRADFVLQTELREFQALYKGADPEGTAPPTVHVRLNAKIIRMPGRAIDASRNFEACIPAADNSIDAIISAFDRGLGRVLKHITHWTLTEDRDPDMPPYSSGCGNTPIDPEDDE